MLFRLKDVKKIMIAKGGLPNCTPKTSNPERFVCVCVCFCVCVHVCTRTRTPQVIIGRSNKSELWKTVEMASEVK